jgi:hypothetical protein
MYREETALFSFYFIFIVALFHKHTHDRIVCFLSLLKWAAGCSFMCAVPPVPRYIPSLAIQLINKRVSGVVERTRKLSF